MIQVLVQLDEATVEALRAVAPAKGRKRSAFIREAIRQALWALEEAKTREAYQRQPEAEPAYLAAAAWEPSAAATARPAARRKVRRRA